MGENHIFQPYLYTIQEEKARVSNLLFLVFKILHIEFIG